MSTYAILGATGNTGGSLLEVLSRDSENQIHALVRSKAKLEKQRPDIVHKSQVHIFQGSITDAQVLVACLTGVRTVFLTVAASTNIPGCTIAQDTARAAVTALETIKEQTPAAKLPRLIMLSTASMDPHLCRDVPKLAVWFLHTTTSYIINDLRIAESFLRPQAKRLDFELVFIKPGGLAHDTQKGHELSLDRQQTFLSFLDLAAGMVEVADEETDRWHGCNVSVLPKGKTRTEWRSAPLLLKGMMFHFLPWTYRFLGP